VPVHIIRSVAAPSPEQRAIVPFTQDDLRALLAACDRSKSYTRPGKRACDHGGSRPVKEGSRSGEDGGGKRETNPSVKRGHVGGHRAPREKPK
jgi:hypothetical protein